VIKKLKIFIAGNITMLLTVSLLQAYNLAYIYGFDKEPYSLLIGEDNEKITDYINSSMSKPSYHSRYFTIEETSHDSEVLSRYEDYIRTLL